MDLLVKKYNYSPNFYGRKKIFTDEYMSKTIIPYIETDTPVQKIIKETGISIKTIDKWSQKTYNMPFRKLYYTDMNKAFFAKLKALQTSKLTLTEMSEKFGHTVKWLLKRFEDFGLNHPKTERQQLLETEIPKMIENGCTLEQMSKKLNENISVLSVWIRKKYGKTLPKIRASKHISIHCEKTDYKFLRSILTKFFEEGRTITEVSEITGMSKPMVYYWTERFNIQTNAKTVKKNMEKNLIPMMKQGFSAAEIGASIGVTRNTVERRIKQLFKKPFGEVQKQFIETLAKH